MLPMRRHASAQTGRGFNVHDGSCRGGWLPAEGQQCADVVVDGRIVIVALYQFHIVGVRAIFPRFHRNLVSGQRAGTSHAAA